MADVVEQQIRLATRYGARLPPELVQHVLGAVVPAARAATVMAVEGRGVLPGRRPYWVGAMSDIRFRAATAERDELVLMFEAPCLAAAAPHLYAQRDFWREPPEKDATALDLLSQVVADVGADNRDSDSYDGHVLRTLARFGRVFADSADARIALCGRMAHPARTELTARTVDQAHALTGATPPPRALRLVGTLDMIRESTQGFAIRLEDGGELSGIHSGSMAELAPLFGRRVLVHGRLIYRPSGRALRIDAERLEAADDSPNSLWTRLPEPPPGRSLAVTLRRPQTPRTGIAALIGGWPGDETDEEIRERLDVLS